MTDTNQLPPMPTPKFTQTIRGVPCITVTEHEHQMRAYALQARAILALRPERVQMTDEQIRSMCKQEWVFETARQWVHVIEAHHGITAQAKKETP